MNKRNILIFFVLMIVLCGAGWMFATSGDDEAKIRTEYEECVEKAERFEKNEVYKKAVVEYGKAYDLIPGYEIAMKAANVNAICGYTDDAVKYWEYAIKADPKQAEPYEKLMANFYNLRKIKTTLGIYDDAVANLEDTSVVDKIRDNIHKSYSSTNTIIEEFLGWNLSIGLTKTENTWNALDRKGNSFYSSEDEEVGMYSRNADNLAVKRDGNWIYIDEFDNKIDLTAGFDTQGMFGNNLAPVSKNNKYGYVFINGDYFDAEDDKWILFDDIDIDKLHFSYDYAGTFDNEVAVVCKDNKWAIINSDMEMVTDFIFDDVICNPFGTCSNANVIIAKKDGAYHLFDKTGQMIGSESFDDAKPFEDQYEDAAAICKNGKWGYISVGGEIVIEPQYDDAISFNSGYFDEDNTSQGFCSSYAPVKINDKWGYIDLHGEVIIEPQFVKASAISRAGVAFVQEEEENPYIKIQFYEYMN